MLRIKFNLEGLFPASPRAANGRRLMAVPASVGAALFLKTHFFSGKFLGCYIKAAQNSIRYVHFLIGIGHKKLPSLNWL